MVTHLVIQRPDWSIRLNDLQVTVADVGRGNTDLVVSKPTFDLRIRLSGAERISLIEALGGKVAP